MMVLECKRLAVQNVTGFQTWYGTLYGVLIVIMEYNILLELKNNLLLDYILLSGLSETRSEWIARALRLN